MPTYANIDGTQKEIKNWYANINAEQKQIHAMFANINAEQKQIYAMEIVYQWYQYNSVGTNYYRWNIYDVITAHTWNKYNSIATTNYNWKKYNAVRQDRYEHKVRPGNAIRFTKGATVMMGTILHFEEQTGKLFGLINQNTDASTLLETGFVYSYSAPPIAEVLPPKRFVGEYVEYNSQEHYSEKIADAYVQGTYISDVTSTSSSAYPNNGLHTDGYWYVSGEATTTYSKGSTSYGVVTSTNRNAYPDNSKHSDGYWYVYDTSTYSKGNSYKGSQESTNRNAYPDNGIHSDGLWYVYAYSDTNYSKGGTYYGMVISTDRNAYPDNGYSYSYWYVYAGIQ